MVIKLIKHDFIESSKKFVPVISMIAATSVLLIILFKSSFHGAGAEFLMLTIAFLAFGLMVAAVVLGAMALINLLYTSMYNKRGYQLFTMPVKTWQIIASKTALVFIWSAIMSIVTIASTSLFLIVVFKDIQAWEYMSSLFTYIFSQIDLRVFAVTTVSSFFNTIYSVGLFLLVGSFINSSYIQNNRNIKMLIFFLIISTVLGNVVGAFGPTDFALNIVTDGAALNNGALDPIVSGWGQFFALDVNIAALQSTLWFALLKGGLGVIFMYGTTWFWDHKLEIID